MPSAPIYLKRKAKRLCPRCGKHVQGRVLCLPCRKKAREETARIYTHKVVNKVCAWSGCGKPAVPDRRMCKGHLTDNRVLANERRERAKLKRKSLLERDKS